MNNLNNYKSLPTVPLSGNDIASGLCKEHRE